MWNIASLLFGRFCGADVHAAINLHGIDRNDFAAETLREFDCYRGFANRGRAAKVKRLAAFHERSAAVSSRRFCSAWREMRNNKPTPVQIAVSAMLNAGKPI